MPVIQSRLTTSTSKPSPTKTKIPTVKELKAKWTPHTTKDRRFVKGGKAYQICFGKKGGHVVDPFDFDEGKKTCRTCLAQAKKWREARKQKKVMEIKDNQVEKEENPKDQDQSNKQETEKPEKAELGTYYDHKGKYQAIMDEWEKQMPMLFSGTYMEVVAKAYHEFYNNGFDNLYCYADPFDSPVNTSDVMYRAYQLVSSIVDEMYEFTEEEREKGEWDDDYEPKDYDLYTEDNIAYVERIADEAVREWQLDRCGECGKCEVCKSE